MHRNGTPSPRNFTCKSVRDISIIAACLRVFLRESQPKVLNLQFTSFSTRHLISILPFIFLFICHISSELLFLYNVYDFHSVLQVCYPVGRLETKRNPFRALVGSEKTMKKKNWRRTIRQAIKCPLDTFRGFLTTIKQKQKKQKLMEKKKTSLATGRLLRKESHRGHDRFYSTSFLSLIHAKHPRSYGLLT
uniref:Uncharacterized protein n=1 Tax=Caenorhabditis japonica TaxID=281687 RepID=A0A8R1EMT3_CAEJA